MLKKIIAIFHFIFYLFPIGIKANQQIKECILNTPVSQSVDLFQGSWIETSIDLHINGLPTFERSFICKERDLSPTAKNWNFSYPNIGKQDTERAKVFDQVALEYDNEQRLIKMQKKDVHHQRLPFWITFEYLENHWIIKTSQNDYLCYDFSPGLEGFKLDRVSINEKRIDYLYQSHPKERKLLIMERKEHNGPWLKMDYNGDGKLISLNRSLDQGVSYFEICQISYQQGKTCVKTPQGVSYHYSFNSIGELLSISTFNSDELYRTEEFRYQNGYLIERILKDASGSILKSDRWSFDSKGNLLSETLAGSLTGKDTMEEEYSKFYRYNQWNQPVEETEENGCKIEYAYDEKNRPAAKFFKNNQRIVNREFYFYDCYNRLIETYSDNSQAVCLDDFNSATSRYKVQYSDFHCLGMPQTILKSIWDFEKQLWIEAEKETQKYTLEGELLSEGIILKENGSEIFISGDLETRCYYSLDNKLILEQKFYRGTLEEETRFNYNVFGFLIEKVNHGGEAIQYHYDFLGRRIKELFPTQEWIEYSYDPLDRIVEVRNSDGNVEKISYNARSQVLKITQHELITQQHQYGLDGSLMNKNVPSDTPYKNAPIPYSKETKKQAAIESSIEWIPTELGTLKKQECWVHLSGSKIKKKYDVLDRVYESLIESPQGETLFKTTYQYNLKGQKTEECRYEKIQDALKLIAKHQWTYSHTGALLRHAEDEHKITNYYYNSLNQLTAVQQPSAVFIFYEYDAMARLIKIHASDYSILYEISYDSLGRVCSSISPKFTQTRIYNCMGQVIEEDLGYGMRLKYEYDVCGRREKIHYPDATSVEYTYQNDLLIEIVRCSKGLPVYSCRYLSYDDAHRPTQLELPKNLGLVEWSWHESGRLATIKAPFFEQSATFDQQQRYSRINTKDPSGFNENSFSYDSLAHLISSERDLHSTAYDLNGNLIRYDQWELTYDALNRLVKISDSSGILHEYLYDLFHRRIADLATDEYYFYDGNCELGMLKNTEIKELRIFGSSTTLDYGSCVAMEFQSELFIPLHDMQGSIKMLLSAETKSVQEYYTYTPYGECQGFSNKALLNPWRFNNKRYDASTGLLHFERRDYLPSIRQFITVDPYNELEGTDPYQYAQNDPLNRKDLFGLKTISQAHILEQLKQTLWNKLISLKEFARYDFHKLRDYMLGHSFLMLCGYNYTKSLSGVYGKGEVNPKVRISFMNGILTDYTSLYTTLRTLSSAHGGENIHFVYRPTNGWVWDITHSIFVRLGWISPEAQLLANTWKAMIEEMGGVNGGGKIIHYAHSIGTIETFRALELLTLEEQTMIEVFAFGSPSLTHGAPHWKISHFASVRDGVSLLDSFQFIKACLGYSPHVTFIGSFWGIPLIDHFFLNQTYQDMWRAMGKTFIQMYGSI